MPKYANWAASVIDEARQSYCKKKGQWGIPAGWGDGATHHKISKQHLALLAKAINTCMAEGGLSKKQQDPERKAAALSFWKTAQQCAGDKVMKSFSNPPVDKILWNMPVNLEVGPEDVLENPGQSFDPNTEVASQELGTRRLTPECVPLQAMERIFLPPLQADHDYLPSADEWVRMDGFLKAANDAFQHDLEQRLGTGLLSVPRTEQWIADATGLRFQRKRLRRFPGAISGRQIYQANHLAGNVQALATAAVNALGIAWPEVSQHQVTDSGGTQHQIQITLNPADLEHMCLRHTYQYFQGAAAIKLVNNFWPVNVVPAVAALHQQITAARPFIAQAVVDYLEIDDFVDYQGRITAADVPAGQRTIFFIAAFDSNDKVDYEIDLETFAPDGADAESYPAAQLTQVIS